MAAGTLGQLDAGGIVGIEDCEVASLLVLEDTRFRVAVDFEGAMAVEMIGRDIQHDRNFGTEGLNGF